GGLFVWSDARGEAFTKLKQAVAGASLLHKPVPGAPIIIETDASEVGIGAVLKQVQEGREVPLEFASKKFTDAGGKWDTRERELFAVKWAVEKWCDCVEKWCDYLALHHFTVRTDHANLRYLVGVDKGKVFRWALALCRFDFTLESLSGEKNNMADWLSRYAAEDEECYAEIEAMAAGAARSAWSEEGWQVVAAGHDWQGARPGATESEGGTELSLWHQWARGSTQEASMFYWPGRCESGKRLPDMCPDSNESSADAQRAEGGSGESERDGHCKPGPRGTI
ncbi:putative RNase HI in long-term repeat retroelement Ty3/gypsy family protein, partial [Gregarina niphandrodes]